MTRQKTKKFGYLWSSLVAYMDDWEFEAHPMETISSHSSYRERLSSIAGIILIDDDDTWDEDLSGPLPPWWCGEIAQIA